MREQDNDRYRPECPLAHELINKLSVIVGHCELLVEQVTERTPAFDRALLIRNLAKSVAKELGRIECDLIRLRNATAKKPTIA
jgi:hypothetical protein